jgi:hypothetical protein
MPTPEIQALPVLSRRAQGRYRDERTGESLLSLVELGEAVLDEHRSALLAEQNLQDPQLQEDARANAEYVQKLLKEML